VRIGSIEVLVFSSLVVEKKLPLTHTGKDSSQRRDGRKDCCYDIDTVFAHFNGGLTSGWGFKG
jgi:hypothetical protein